MPVLVGHGDMKGKNGDITADISNISTAKDIFTIIALNYIPEVKN